MLSNPFAQKIILTVLAIGAYTLTAVPGLGDVSEPLKVLAGLLVGAAWVARPGDAQLLEAGRKSIKPPPGKSLLVLPLLFMLGCAGGPADTALQNRLAANELRDTVNEASDTLAQAHGALPFICAYFGRRSASCESLEDGYRITSSAIDTVHRGIDLLDAVGVGAEQTRSAAERVLSEAKAFGSAVQRTGEEVSHAIEADRLGGGAGGPVPERGPDAEGTPAAQDGSAAPAAAPAP